MTTIATLPAPRSSFRSGLGSALASALLLVTLTLLTLFRAEAAPRLIAPNGGERFRVGSTTTIRWEGTAPTDTVRLEYSTDRGATWRLITDAATGSDYVWRNIPRTPSDLCLMRIATRASIGDSVLWLKRIVEGHSLAEAVHFAEFSPDGTRVLGGEAEGSVTIWDSYTGAIILTVPVESRANIPSPPGITLISSARYSPDGRVFATISPLPNSAGSMVRIFDATSGAKLREWSKPEPSRSSTSASCVFSPDGSKLLVTGLGGGTVYNVADGSVAAQITGYTSTSPSVISSMLEADWRRDGGAIIGAAFATPGAIPAFTLSDPVTGGVLRTYDFSPTSIISCVRFTPDGARFISTSNDGLARVWDVATATSPYSVSGFDQYPNWVAITHDGSAFALAGQENTRPNWKLKLYNSSDGTFIRTIAAIGNGMRNAEFSPDDARILVSCIDGVRIFHTRDTTPPTADTSDALWSIYISDGATVTVAAPRIAARQGETVAVPITIDAPEEAIGAGATRIDLSLSFDATLLEPIGDTPRGAITGGTRTIPLSFPLDAPTDTILGTLLFRAALGDDSLTTLGILSPTTDVATVTVLKRDGSFTMLDLCVQGGVRLIDPNGKAVVKIIAAPPAADYVDVEVRTIERGATTLTLVGIDGRAIRDYLRSDSPPEIWRERIGLADVATGRYLLVLRTPTIVTSTKLEVTR